MGAQSRGLLVCDRGIMAGLSGRMRVLHGQIGVCEPQPHGLFTTLVSKARGVVAVTGVHHRMGGLMPA